jgi:uncharacterized protein YukE
MDLIYPTNTAGADVAAMNAMAVTLRQRAATLTDVSRRLDAQVASMVYAGPAADQFRTNTADRRQRLLRAAAELEALSATVTRAAITAEADARASGYPAFY